MRKFCCMLSASFLFMLAVNAGTQASAAVLQDRITQPIENANVMPVAGTVNPMARAEFDQGLIDNAKVLDGLRLTFKRSDAQEASLKALLLAQQDPTSPSYHHWLTPTQFGQQFGMTAADIAKASDWLQAQGFTVTWVSESNNAIGFSGSVASVEKAFQTQIHSYRVNGETHFANATNISVPAALSGLVTGVRGLDDFRPKPKVRYAKSNALNAKPQFTSGVSGSHYLTPPDMATIYDIGPLYSAGVTGKGVTIAIMGQTDIVPADIADFRAAAGLPANPPTVVTAPGTTPLSAPAGAASGDLSETDLDLEYSGGIATGASIVLVNSDNVFTSLQYAVQSTIGGIAIPIISLSYGACEPSFATSDLTQIEGFLSQANAQGQTVMLASGDSGAADCDDSSGSNADHFRNQRPADRLPRQQRICNRRGRHRVYGRRHGRCAADRRRHLLERQWNRRGSQRPRCFRQVVYPRDGVERHHVLHQPGLWLFRGRGRRQQAMEEAFLANGRAQHTSRWLPRRPGYFSAGIARS